MPEDPPLTSAYSVHDVVCDDPLFGYWSGLSSVWDSDRTLVNVEHDVEFSDDLVAELLSCPHDLCAFPYRVMPFGWPGGTWGASYGFLWVTEGQPWAMFTSIGFCKISAEVRVGTTLQQVVWDKVEGSIHKAAVQNRRMWHLHWPAISHYHDYGDIDPEAGTTYNLVKRARDEGRLIVHGDPMTDECLEGLKSHDPLVYDESLRRAAQKLCID
jgi:hypothetical protein